MALWTPADSTVQPILMIRDADAVWTGSSLTSIVNSGTDGGSFTLVGTPDKGTAINGLDPIRFDANTEALRKTMDFPNSGKMSVFYYSRMITAGVNGIVNKAWIDGSGSPGMVLYGNLTGTAENSSFYGNVSLPAFTFNPPNWEANAQLQGTGQIRAIYTQIGTTNDAWSDGTQLGFNSSTTGAVPNHGSYAWEFGRGQLAGSETANSEFLCLAVFPDWLTTDERQKWEGYWAHRGGTQTQLPIGHPYRTSPPTTGTETPKTVTVTSAGTVSVVKRPGKIVAASRAGVVAVVKRPGKIVAIARPATVTLLRQTAKRVSLTGTATVALLRQTAKRVAVTGAGVVSVVKRPGRTVSVVGATAVSVTKSALKMVVTTPSATVALSRQVLKTVGASLSSAVSVATGGLTVPQTVTVAAAGTVAMSRSIGKSVAVTSAGAVSLVKSALRRVVIASTATVSVLAPRTVLRGIAVVSSAAVSTLKSAAKRVSVSSAGIVSVTKTAQHIVALASAASVAVVGVKARLLEITVGATTAVAVSRRTLKSLMVSGLATVGLARQISKTLSALSAPVVSVLKTFPKVISVASTTSVTVLRGLVFNHLVSVAVSGTVAVAFAFAIQIEVMAIAAVSLRKAIAKTVVSSVSTVTSIFFGLATVPRNKRVAIVSMERRLALVGATVSRTAFVQAGPSRVARVIRED